jgi:hypothetical protein
MLGPYKPVQRRIESALNAVGFNTRRVALALTDAACQLFAPDCGATNSYADANRSKICERPQSRRYATLTRGGYMSRSRGDCSRMLWGRAFAGLSVGKPVIPDPAAITSAPRKG